MKKIKIYILLLTFLIPNIYAQARIDTQVNPQNTNQIQPSTNQTQSQQQNTNNQSTIKKEIPKKSHYNLKHKFLEQKNEYDAKIFTYQKGKTFIINLTLLLDTIIVLPADDNILQFRLNGSKFFDANIVKNKNIPTNKIYVKAKSSGVSTNLTIVTQKDNIYQFVLVSNKINSNIIPDFIVYIKNTNQLDLKYITEDNNNNSNSNDYNIKSENYSKSNRIYTLQELKDNIRPDPQTQIHDYLQIIDRLDANDLKNINLIETNYTVAYNKKIDNPILVFDDGRWTYFKFTETNSLQGIKLPTISTVENRVESPTNPFVVNNYIIVKTTAKDFILRRNKEYTCISRNKKPKKI